MKIAHFQPPTFNLQPHASRVPDSGFGFRPSFGLSPRCRAVAAGRISVFGLPTRFGLRISALIGLILATGCTSPHPLRGGRAVTAPSPSGAIAQTLTQGENPSAPSRQTQETVRVRTYTLPAGSIIQQSLLPPATGVKYEQFADFDLLKDVSGTLSHYSRWQL